jgi:hypothetical protein
MIDGLWFVAGVTFGLLLSTIVIPPTRNVSKVPDPTDEERIYYTETGCVRVEATEVPCTSETDSFNLLASLKK